MTRARSNSRCYKIVNYIKILSGQVSNLSSMHNRYSSPILEFHFIYRTICIALKKAVQAYGSSRSTRTAPFQCDPPGSSCLVLAQYHNESAPTTGGVAISEAISCPSPKAVSAWWELWECPFWKVPGAKCYFLWAAQKGNTLGWLYMFFQATALHLSYSSAWYLLWHNNLGMKYMRRAGKAIKMAQRRICLAAAGWIQQLLLVGY